MKRNNLFPIRVFLKFHILVVVLLASRCSCADHFFELCVPKSCVYGPNISYPFRISEQQDPYCGYPGFELSCSSQGYPVLRLNDNDYVVDEILYERSSFRLHNAVFDGEDRVCPPEIKNFSVGNSPFRAVEESGSYLHFLTDCNSTSLTSDLEKYRVECTGEGSGSGLVIYGEDENLEKALAVCRNNVVAPMEVPGGDDLSNVVGQFQEVGRRGFELNWIASDCSECRESGGRCGFNASRYHFECFCTDRPHSASCKPKDDKKLPLILGTVSGAAFIFIVCLTIFIVWRRKKRIKSDSFLLSLSMSSDPSSKADLEAGGVYLGVPIYSYTELEVATASFDSSNELGDGGFGIVYYGKLKDGREVAIKRLYEHNFKRMEHFMNEIKILTSLRHPNLVSLYGCTSRRSRELLLVYEFIPNGTVADHLHGDRAENKSLTWPVRMNIAIETATALAYLHKSDIIHRDVKTHNILLDHNFCVKVADFGLSRLFPTNATHVSTAPQGTPGYVDPEYHECYQLTDKSDVYSFGVVLIELISSLPAVDISRHRHEINLANLAISRIQRNALDELIDSSLGYGSDSEISRMISSVAELAFRCLQLEKEMRPSMDEVVETLEAIRDGKEESNHHQPGFQGVAKVPASPESEESGLLRNMKMHPTSPISVTEKWVSGSSTASGSA